MKLLKIFFTMALLMQITFAQSTSDYSNSKSSLLQFSSITVTIGGDFIVNGSFPAMPTQRVDLLITQIFIEAKKEALGVTNEFKYTKKIIDELKKYSQRNIKIIHAEGSQEIVDLEKFRITGNFKYNPYLKNDDVIVFPPYNPEIDYVIIDGAVNKTGKYQYVDGDKLSDILLLSSGISNAYENVKKVKITRLSYDGESESEIILGLNDDFDLQRGDRIKVIADEPFRNDYKVRVNGEVKNPGIIYITKNNTILSEVIKKAGGLTDNAWLKKMSIVRGEASELLMNDKIINEIDLKEINRKLKLDNFAMMRMADLQSEDTLYFNIENELRFYNNLGNLDFTKLDDSLSEVSKLIVKDGDIINIPVFENVVFVYGQVPNGGKYNFEPGKSCQYYINQAGGFGELALDDEVKLIKGDSKNWITVDDDDNQPVIEPGDYIFVPKDPPRNFAFYLSRIGDISGIIGTIATVVLLLTQLRK